MVTGCHEKDKSLLDPLIRLALRRAKLILTISKDITGRLKKSIADKSLVLSQNAISPELIKKKPREHDLDLKILSVGQLVSIKGYPLTLSAFKKHSERHNKSHLEIVGTGPLKSDLVQLACSLGVIDCVNFTGQISRDEVLKKMSQSHVLLFPSFEGAGMVVIEAMAKGLPVVCLDFGGPGEYVTDECGIKVPLTEPEDVIQGLADALSRLASEPELYERLSQGAIERVRNHYLWNRVGERLNLLYHQVLDEASGR